MKKLSDFDFLLPKEFIAQSPASPRDACRLLVYDVKKDSVHHDYFYNLGRFLEPYNVLVLNRSKVLKARIKFFFGGKQREIFFLKQLSENQCEVLVRPGKFFTKGRKFNIDRDLEVKVLSVKNDGARVIEISLKGRKLMDVLDHLGEVPLPPYIKTNGKFDPVFYQTIYAREAGSVAAPTAGLHFTGDLFRKLKLNGIQLEELLLHVSRGTFSPVSTEKLQNHIMHKECFKLDLLTAKRLNEARSKNKKIVAVGTTSVRVLESCFYENKFHAKTGETDLFIFPKNYKWKVVDKLITNFHLPKTTLLMLVASFLEYKGCDNGTRKILGLYKLAMANNYRFYSFGDAMLIL